MEKVNGEKLIDVPLFILVNNETASGAEGFSYVMKNQKRGTIIGETTRGAAHSGGTWYIDGYSIFVPNERNISPVTNTDWESVGVIPDVKTANDEAYGVAVDMAKRAARDYRTNRDELITTKFKSLWQLLGMADKGRLNAGEESEINKIVNDLTNRKILNEGKINNLGYQYIELEMPKAAELIFKSNTLIYPNSINVYDSYAEALAINGKLEESINNYEKAVQLATEQGSGNLALYQKNLEKVKEMLNSKK